MKKKTKHRQLVDSLMGKYADLYLKGFNRWWKKNDYKGPTFYDCYIKGFEDGVKYEKRKPNA